MSDNWNHPEQFVVNSYDDPNEVHWVDMQETDYQQPYSPPEGQAWLNASTLAGAQTPLFLETVVEHANRTGKSPVEP